MEIPLIDEKSVGEGETKEIDFAGRPAIVVRHRGKIRAYINCCTHVGGPMKLTGDRLLCQWHGSFFDPETGQALNEPAPLDSKLIELPTKIINGKVTYVYP